MMRKGVECEESFEFRISNFEFKNKPGTRLASRGPGYSEWFTVSR